VLVRRGNRAGVSDRTPVLFGPRRDLAHITNDAGGIAAIRAVGLLDGVEVGELAAVDGEKRPPWYPGDAVERELGP